MFWFFNSYRGLQWKELEDSLVENITKFLLELGAGFPYIGRQYKLEVGKSDFYIDLLFYHVKLHSYVVVELKTGEFKPLKIKGSPAFIQLYEKIEITTTQATGGDLYYGIFESLFRHHITLLRLEY